MDSLYVVLALISALLHAGWNAAVKARPNVTHAMTAQMVVAALIMAPLLLVTGLPAVASVPWMLLSTAINTVTVTAMLRAYALAGFGLVYPIGRAISVLLVVPGAALLLGEHISASAVLGVATISVALALLAYGGRGAGRVPARAWAWIALAGVATAAYVLADARGVRAAGSAIAYGCCTSLLNAIVMLWRQRGTAISMVDIKREGLAMTPVAMASVVSYLLILWIYTKAPIAPASALRDTSALFAILIAVVWLKERLTRVQVAALVLAASAIPLLRYA